MLTQTKDITYELELLRLQKIIFDYTGSCDPLDLCGDYLSDVIFETLDTIFDEGWCEYLEDEDIEEWNFWDPLFDRYTSLCHAPMCQDNPCIQVEKQIEHYFESNGCDADFEFCTFQGESNDQARPYLQIHCYSFPTVDLIKSLFEVKKLFEGQISKLEQLSATVALSQEG